MQVPVPAETSPLWQVFQGITLTMTTLGVGWTARTVFHLRDEVRDLKTALFGRDGKNGMKSVQDSHAHSIEQIERRHAVEDAVHEAERREYEGEDRRRQPRRMIDRVKEGLDDVHP